MMEQTKDLKAMTAQQAKSCAQTVGRAAALFAATFFVVGAAIEHLQELAMIIRFLWQALMFTASLGGFFWGAMVTGAMGFAVLAWALCTIYRVSNKEPDANLGNFWWFALAGLVAWGLALFALSGLYDSYTNLPVYQALAVACMYFAGIVVAAGAIISICAMFEE